MKRFALISAALVLTVAGCAQSPEPVSEKVQEYYDKSVVNASPMPTATAVKVGMPVTTRPKVAEAVALLKDPAREWTMTILGDSTGNDSDEFVYLTAERLSTEYDRPVILHPWAGSKGYEGEVTIGGGGNAPIHIWNGSVPGSEGSLAVNNLAAMAPKSDLTVINYGHNYKGSWGAQTTTNRLVRALDKQSGAKAMLFILQNPQNPETATSKAIVDLFRTSTKEAGYEVADVYGAFKTKGNIAPLMLDNLHPNPAGSKVWAEAFTARLVD